LRVARAPSSNERLPGRERFRQCAFTDLAVRARPRTTCFAVSAASAESCGWPHAPGVSGSIPRSMTPTRRRSSCTARSMDNASYVFTAFVALLEKGIPFEVRSWDHRSGDQPHGRPPIAKSFAHRRFPSIDHRGLRARPSRRRHEYLDEAFPSPRVSFRGAAARTYSRGRGRGRSWVEILTT